MLRHLLFDVSLFCCDGFQRVENGIQRIVCAAVCDALQHDERIGKVDIAVPVGIQAHGGIVKIIRFGERVSDIF